MTPEQLVDRIITEYYADAPIPERALQIYEEAKRYFGEPFVDFHDGLHNYPEEIRQEVIRPIIKSVSVRVSYNWYYYDSVVNESQSTINAFINEAYKILDSCVWARWAVVLHFPKRIIKNEKDEQMPIYDLFVRLCIKKDGTCNPRKFYYFRSKYTLKQFLSGYRHSHTPSINRDNPIIDWEEVCTGSGPINNTCSTLAAATEFDESLWGLFFWELDKIIDIESETGGPYLHMSSVGQNGEIRDTCAFLTGNQRLHIPFWIKSFLKSYLHTERFKVVYQNKGYCLGTSFLEWLIDISDYYKQWVNAVSERDLLEPTNYPDLLSTYYIKDNALVTPPTTTGPYVRVARRLNQENKTAIIFKGQPFTFYVDVDNDEAAISTAELLDYNFAAALLYLLLQTLNYRYEQTTTENTEQDAASQWRKLILEGLGKGKQRSPDKKAYFL